MGGEWGREEKGVPRLRRKESEGERERETEKWRPCFASLAVSATLLLSPFSVLFLHSFLSSLCAC